MHSLQRDCVTRIVNGYHRISVAILVIVETQARPVTGSGTMFAAIS
jgi:hypothetical protein